MVYKFSRIQCVSCVATRLRKMFPILGLLACCVVSPAVAGETTPTDVSDQPASVQMINNSIERQMRAFEAALENSWHTDAQTTRLDELNLSALTERDAWEAVARFHKAKPTPAILRSLKNAYRL